MSSAGQSVFPLLLITLSGFFALTLLCFEYINYLLTKLFKITEPKTKHLSHAYLAANSMLLTVFYLPLTYLFTLWVPNILNTSFFLLFLAFFITVLLPFLIIIGAPLNFFVLHNFLKILDSSKKKSEPPIVKMAAVSVLKITGVMIAAPVFCGILFFSVFYALFSDFPSSFFPEGSMAVDPLLFGIIAIIIAKIIISLCLFFIYRWMITAARKNTVALTEQFVASALTAAVPAAALLFAAVILAIVFS